MYIVELNDSLKQRAIETLVKRESLSLAMKIFMEQVAQNHLEVMQFWVDVEAEAIKLGIDKAPDEIISFDFINKQFIVTLKK